MFLHKRSFIGLISATLLAGIVLPGCGGNSTTPSTGGGMLVTGGVTTTSGTGTPGVASGAQPTQVQIIVNGSTVTGTMPQGMIIPASGNVIVIPTGTKLLSGLSVPSEYHLKSAGSGFVGAIKTATPGSITWNGQYIGNLGTDGTLQESIVLGAINTGLGGGQLAIVGPINIASTNSSGSLQVTGSITYNLGTLDGDGATWVTPYSISGTFPINSGYVRNNHVLSRWAGGSASTTTTKIFGLSDLALAWPGAAFDEEQSVVNGSVTYTGKQSVQQVPSGGISTVVFSFKNPTTHP